MKLWAGDIPRNADVAQNLSSLQLLPFADDQTVEMRVRRNPLSVVLNQDQIAEFLELIGREDHHAGQRGCNPLAPSRSDVDTVVYDTTLPRTKGRRIAPSACRTRATTASPIR